jgi:hypothetical protein
MVLEKDGVGPIVLKVVLHRVKEKKYPTYNKMKKG